MNDYALWYAEIHPTETGFEITHKITAHLAVRITWGSAVIVCDTPHNLVPTFQKRWEEVLRIIEGEYATTSGTAARAELKRYLNSLQAVTFLAGLPDGHAHATSTVWLVDLDSFQKVTPSIETIYVMTTNLGMPQLLFWVRQIKESGQIVLFRKESLGFVTDKRAQVPTRIKIRKEKIINENTTV